MAVLILLVCADAFITGCAVKLAPSVDAIIVQSLNKANEQAMTVFASVSTNVDHAAFAERETKYNETIGTIEAARLLAAARPNPTPPNIKLVALKPSGQEGKTSEFLAAPTPTILKRAIGTITQMRETDREGNLTPFLAAGFKQAFEISMDQALTYEKALQR